MADPAPSVTANLTALAALRSLLHETQSVAVKQGEHATAARARLDGSFSALEVGFQSMTQALHTAQNELEHEEAAALHELSSLQTEISAKQALLDNEFHHFQVESANWKAHLHDLREKADHSISLTSQNAQAFLTSIFALRTQLNQSEQHFTQTLQSLRGSLAHRVQQLAQDSQRVEGEFSNLFDSLKQGASQSVERLRQTEVHIADAFAIVAQQTADQNEATSNSLQNQLGEKISEPLSGSASELLSQITGLGQETPNLIEELTSQSQGVLDAISQIVNLIEQIKPVLELVKALS